MLKLRLIIQLSVNITMSERRFQTSQKDTELESPSRLYLTYSQKNSKNSFNQLSIRSLPDVSLTENRNILNPQTLKNYLLRVLQESNNELIIRVRQSVKAWIKSEWNEVRGQVSGRISKLHYLFQSIQDESFGVIEQEVIKEWKKNELLKNLQFLWNYALRSKQFRGRINLQSCYNDYRQIVTNINWFIFAPAFNTLNQKGFPLRYRLYSHTAVKIVTGCKEWLRHSAQIVKMSFFQETSTFSETFKLQSLEANPEIVDVREDGLYPQTAKSIERLLICCRFQEITVGLQQFRASLMREMRQNIEKNTKKAIVVQKQDILTCIMYVLVKYKLDHLVIALRYIEFLLGSEISQVLSQFHIDSFKTDLDVAYEFVSSPVIEVEQFQLERRLLSTNE